jgi:hypothetical protein
MDMNSAGLLDFRQQIAFAKLSGTQHDRIGALTVSQF